jgi:AcrR family transcriptional regulator
LTLEVPQHYRKRPRQARSKRTVGALLDATEAVLRTHGYPGASTNRIAQTAGLSVGSLYQYFGDKDGLIGAAIERVLAREADALAHLAEGAHSRSLADGLADVALEALRGREAQRELLGVLSEHGLRFGPGPTLQLVARHQRGRPDPVQRLLTARRAELRDARLETLCHSVAVLLNVATFAYAVEQPGQIAPERLVAFLGEALARHVCEPPPARALPSVDESGVEVSRVRSLLHDACRSSRARAALLDELVFEEQCRLDALCGPGGAAPEQVCEGLLRFWASTGRELARAAGALAGPSLDREAWALRAERRSRRLRSWLAELHEGGTGEALEPAVFVLGHGFLEIGLLFAGARLPVEVAEERIADVGDALGVCARLAAASPTALAGGAFPQ